MSVESYSVTKGYCVIFDNYDFEDEDDNRVGSHKDSDNFKRVFKIVLGYGCDVIYNKTKMEMIEEIDKIRKKINVKILKPDPFVAIFLSHGEESSIRGTDEDEDNAYIYIREIMDFFSDQKCPLLKDTLKLVIVCACRGGEEDRGVLYRPSKDGESTQSETDVFDFNENIAHQNFLVCYSTIYGFTSIISRSKGTLFGSKLSEKIELHAKNYDFEYILKLVQKEVEKQNLKVRVDDEVLTCKQTTSWFANNISKKIYLTQSSDPQSLSMNEDKYKLNESHKRICLIFDLYDFDDDTILDEVGSHRESRIYKETFEEMRFETTVYKESENGSQLEKKEIESIIDENKLKRCSVFTMIFLSHGSENSIECSDGPLLTSRIEKKICNKECKELIGIPKILIFSPIYENELTVREEVYEEYNKEENSGKKTKNTSRNKTKVDAQEKLIATFGDIIKCYSTINVEDTLRSPIYGTFYGSVFKSVITKYHKSHHFEDLLKLVQKELNEGEGKLSDGSIVKQSTCWEVKGIAKNLYL